MDFEEFQKSEEANIDADKSLQDAVKQFNADSEEPDEQPKIVEPETPPVIATPAESVEPPKAEPEKVMDLEERSRNAERRRQHEATIAQKALENSVEYKAMQTLARMSGRTVDQLWQDVYEAQVAQEAQAQYGQELPYETVQAIAHERQYAAQAYQQQNEVQEQLTQLQFEQWQGRIEQEKQQILTAHPYLSGDDIDAARDYMLTVVQNPTIPLEQTVYALHGSKILAGQQEKMRTELLAEMSGRKNSPLPRQGSATPPAESLTADERYVAKMLGISEEDYLKNK